DPADRSRIQRTRPQRRFHSQWCDASFEAGRRGDYSRRHRPLVHADRRSHHVSDGPDRSGQGGSTEGRSGVAAVSGHSGEEVKTLVAALIVCGMFAVAQKTRSVWDGVYTKDQAKRGDRYYGPKCANCHGDELEGDAEAPELSGPNFLWKWKDATLDELFTR